MLHARQAKGISQAALAALMSASGYNWRQSTVYSIENGQRRVQLAEAMRVAELLGLELTDMLHPGGAALRGQLIEAIEMFLEMCGPQLASAVNNALTARGRLIVMVEGAEREGVAGKAFPESEVSDLISERYDGKYRRFTLGQLVSYSRVILEDSFSELIERYRESG